MVLGPAQVAEVDREASDGDHGGADSQQQDEDVGRGVHSAALHSSLPCSLLRLQSGLGGSDQNPHHKLILVWQVQHATTTGAGEATSMCYVDAGQQDALATMFSAHKMLLFNFQEFVYDSTMLFMKTHYTGCFLAICKSENEK